MIPFAAIGLAAKVLAGKAVSNAKSDWQAIPPKWKLGILAALALIGGYFIHQHVAHKHLKAADAAGYNRARAENAKLVAALRARTQAAEANVFRITQEVRNRHDQEVHANAVAADALLVRGAGAAGCRLIRDPAVRTSSGGPVNSASAVNAPVDRLPDQGGAELIALPFAGAVAFGQSHDNLIAEVKAWREWYPKVAAQQNALKQPLAKPAK